MPRRRLVLPAVLALMLSACAGHQEPASGAPTEYHQGAYRPVRPPTFRPHEDAPHTVGQPGHVRPGIQLEPGPRPEALPHTPQTRREDTIWAAREPERGEVPAILGLKLPIMEDRPDVEPLVRECAGLMNRALDETGMREQASNRSDIDKACLAGRLHLACAEAMIKRLAVTTPDFKRASSAEFKRAEAFYESALQFFARCYAGNQNDPLFEAVKKAFNKEWANGRR